MIPEESRRFQARLVGTGHALCLHFFDVNLIPPKSIVNCLRDSCKNLTLADKTTSYSSSALSTLMMYGRSLFYWSRLINHSPRPIFLLKYLFHEKITCTAFNSHHHVNECTVCN